MRIGSSAWYEAHPEAPTWAEAQADLAQDKANPVQPHPGLAAMIRERTEAYEQQQAAQWEWEKTCPW